MLTFGHLVGFPLCDVAIICFFSHTSGSIYSKYFEVYIDNQNVWLTFWE